MAAVFHFIAGSLRGLRAFDWRLCASEMLALATLAGLVLVIILWMVGLTPPMVS